MSHVHGLGVDPADGTLYAATHYGLFRIPERGRAARAADRFQHHGVHRRRPEAFLAEGDDLYAAVRDEGSFRSSDAGRTWQLRYRDG